MELGILAAIAGIVGVISGILASWVKFCKNVRKDNNKEGERMGALQSDIGYIKEWTISNENRTSWKNVIMSSRAGKGC